MRKGEGGSRKWEGGRKTISDTATRIAGAAGCRRVPCPRLPWACPELHGQDATLVVLAIEAHDPACRIKSLTPAWCVAILRAAPNFRRDWHKERIMTRTLTIIVLLCCATRARAELVLENADLSQPLNEINGPGKFGQGVQYEAETFTVPVGAGPAESLSFWVRSNGPEDFAFHILVTDWDGSPHNVLYESATLLVKPEYSQGHIFSLDLGHLNLTPGQRYAWIADSFVERDANAQLVHTGNFNLGTALMAQFLPNEQLYETEEYGNTREENFAKPWFGFSSPQQLAFQMTFASVPEPSSATLLLLAVLGCYATCRRRSMSGAGQPCSPVGQGLP